MSILGIPAELYVFEDGLAAWCELYRPQRPPNSNQGVQDDIRTLLVRGQYAIGQLYTAMRNDPTPLVINGEADPWTKSVQDLELIRFQRWTEKYDDKEALNKRLSAVAALVFGQIKTLHEDGDSISENNYPNALHPWDLHCTATQRFRKILEIFRDNKKMVLMCERGMDSVIRFVAFPVTYDRRTYDPTYDPRTFDPTFDYAHVENATHRLVTAANAEIQRLRGDGGSASISMVGVQNAREGLALADDTPQPRDIGSQYQSERETLQVLEHQTPKKGRRIKSVKTPYQERSNFPLPPESGANTSSQN